ncbi:MAG TPA: gamma-glutamyl-gamma-aminobutyrate hydrolase family protein [Thermoanaerobaculia bacterium]|nr:gamma-glutamyl-gamma-aminobutyrate hydrolase family protein [Thermoanaerobaculia bacterium]
MPKILVAAHESRESEAVLDALSRVGVADDDLLPVHSGDGPVDVPAALDAAAGLVLCGGADLHPRYYGEEPIPQARVSLQEGRDEMEWELVAAARERRLPVWAICRGMQVMNVFLGGDLWQDMTLQRPGIVAHHVSWPRDALLHRALVTAAGRGTAMGEVLGRETAWVNSRHHQAVRREAADLVTVAVSPDGVVEAQVLDGGDWWVEAVEWHPENLMAMAQQRALAERFTAAVAARRES